MNFTFYFFLGHSQQFKDIFRVRNLGLQIYQKKRPMLNCIRVRIALLIFKSVRQIVVTGLAALP